MVRTAPADGTTERSRLSSRRVPLGEGQEGQDPKGSGARRRWAAQDRRRHPRRRDPTSPHPDGRGSSRKVHRSRSRLSDLPLGDEEQVAHGPFELYKVFFPAREAAGRKDLHWHDLRHTGAVLAAQTGASLAELMGRLGHTTPGAAMRYQHAAADRDAEIARRVSALAEQG
jgi:integrase